MRSLAALTCRFVLVLAFSVGVPSATALADPPVPLRTMAVKWDGQVPTLSFSSRDFVTREVAEKLDSGLPQRIITRIYAYAEGGERPLTATVLSCRVVYDLWEGVYRIQEQTATTDRTRTLPDQTAVTHACLDVRSLVLGSADVFARYRGRKVYFAVIVELNPLSPDTVQRIRRWLSKSSGGQVRGDAFFGSFVSIFVSRRMGSAERTLSFRSSSRSVPP